MDSPKEFFSKHPYVAGGGVFVIGLLILYWLGFFSGSQTTGSNDAGYYAAQAAAIASGNQLAASQLAAQVATTGINASVTKDAADNAAATAMAKIAGDSATTQASIAGEVAKLGITTKGNVDIATATLAASTTNLTNTLAEKLGEVNSNNAAYTNTVNVLGAAGTSVITDTLNTMRDTTAAGFAAQGINVPSYIGQSTLQGLYSTGITGFQQIADAVVNLRPNYP